MRTIRLPRDAPPLVTTIGYVADPEPCRHRTHQSYANLPTCASLAEWRRIAARRLNPATESPGPFPQTRTAEARGGPSCHRDSR
jgi:hypothetical protein